MRINASPDVDRVSPEDFPRYVAIFLNQVVTAFGNNLNFDENFSSKTITVNFPAANVDVATPHGLGRVPTNYIQAGQSAPLSVYDGASANTTQIIYLRSNAVGNCRLVVF